MGRKTDDDIAMVTKQGHRVFTSSGQVEVSFATGIAVHRDLTDYIHHVTHHARFTTVTLRLAHEAHANRVLLKPISVHIPSSINSQDEQIDTALRQLEGAIPGKRHMTIIAGDWNAELSTDTNADVCIGKAIRQRHIDRASRAATPHEYRRSNSIADDIIHMLRGKRLTVPSTYDAWWTTATCDEDCYDTTRTTTTRTTTTATPSTPTPQQQPR